MRKQIHLQTRNGVYYFRRRIPEDLLHLYLPKREFIFSLGTRDPAKADRLQRKSSVTLDDEFHQVRLGLKAPDTHITLLGAANPVAFPITYATHAASPAQQPKTESPLIY